MDKKQAALNILESEKAARAAGMTNGIFDIMIRVGHLSAEFGRRSRPSHGMAIISEVMKMNSDDDLKYEDGMRKLYEKYAAIFKDEFGKEFVPMAAEEFRRRVEIDADGE